MADMFKAELKIRFTTDPVFGTGYDKDKLVKEGDSRVLVEAELTATTLEKLQEKLTAYVGLAEV